MSLPSFFLLHVVARSLGTAKPSATSGKRRLFSSTPLLPRDIHTRYTSRVTFCPFRCFFFILGFPLLLCSGEGLSFFLNLRFSFHRVYDTVTVLRLFPLAFPIRHTFLPSMVLEANHSVPLLPFPFLSHLSSLDDSSPATRIFSSVAFCFPGPL